MNIEKFTQQFRHALVNECGVSESSRILVAVSGGADSMALLHLLRYTGMKCLAVHCNFSLRGSESDEDEAFVKKICKEWAFELITERFDTTSYATENGVSIEMAARQLRYNFFYSLAKKNNIDWIATGHHGDDAIETFFLNLARGTGLKGLTGIAYQRDSIIRPLLFATSQEIIEYCNQNSIPFRTDSTNHETTFLRNKIRHQIVPLFKEINPAFFNTMQNNMEYLGEAWQIFISEAAKVKEQMVAETEDSILIPIKLINEHPQKKSMLFEILQTYGFSGVMMDNIIESMNGIPGKQFFSHSHRLVVDRYNLILVPRMEIDVNDYYINSETELTQKPIKLSIKTFPKKEDFSFSVNPKKVHLDADLIDFPLKIRKPKPGDRFQPLGMIDFKKISDFFIDEKLSLVEKENTWLLINNDDIAWVIGHRIDNRYKITSATKTILEVSVRD
ncbi:tRNA lysidine(34) synthetase TilS [Alkalitalea saponilacus]|uniref:tRNA(Ile)-lysidine synthase n=2 Tax=Alkalitalea saponilacus TaxID=889453 RepID=A0A1T5EVI4_9BACT|nr:tRNA lysidine(34) synthetase TilS [Alkalitalea saponilacus]SKB87974.1 tRNA(Ile)-lysidine synthase [Alkalitalea saponilacus]